MKRKKSILWPALIPIYAFSLLLVILPIIYVIYVSFMTRDELWGYVNQFTFSNYGRVFEPQYFKTFLLSMKLALITTAVTLIIGYPFGYFMCKLRTSTRNIVLLLVIIPFWTNSLVRLYGWMILLSSNGVINGALMKLGWISEPLKLLFNSGSTVLGMVYALIPFMILPTYTSVEKLDWSLVEASRDLGASKFKAFLTVTLKQTLPGISSGCILVFIPSIGLFFVSDLMGGAKVMLLGNLIKNELLTAHDWPFGAALSVIMLGMTLLVIWICRRVSGSRTLEGF